ncbi:MAG: hypothetical protein ACI9WU_000574 [Myxococcota bacterium]|jgi:hypothetical protein
MNPRMARTTRWNPIKTIAVVAALATTVSAGCSSDDAAVTACPEGEVLIAEACVPSGSDTTTTAGTGDATTGDATTGDATGSDTTGGDTTDGTTDGGTTGGDTTGSDTTGADDGAEMPFAIDDHYAPSGYFPEGEAGNIQPEPACPMRAGDEAGVCHGFSWTPGSSEGFAGVWWQHPDGNWGDDPGLEVAAGATALTFWAWGAAGGETVRFLSGFASDGFELSTEELTLTTTPTEYTIHFGTASYTTIAGGFGWVATGAAGTGPADPAAVTLFIDDIQLTNSATAAGCTDANANNYDMDAEVDDGNCTYDAVPLPLVIDDHYAPSGFFPEEEASNIDADGACTGRADDAKGSCHAFTWTPGSGTFAGVWWQYPEGNWDGPGLEVEAGATAITFTAWGATGGEVVKFLSGFATDGYERDTGDLTLTTTPTQYTLDLTGTTYETIAGGFGWVTTGAATFYIDNIEMIATTVAGAGCTDPEANNYDAEADGDDGSCLYDVTFEVDLSCSGVTPTAPVAVTGPFCDWCAAGFDLADGDGDGVWSGTFPFQAGPLEYKYMANGFDIQEDLIGAGACAVVTDGATFANRQVTIGGTATNSDVWGQCTACGDVNPELTPIDLPVTFDVADVDYTLTDFGGTATTLVADPLDAGNQVASTVKSGSAELWAGTTMNEDPGGGFVSVIPFSATDTQMTVRVYSPDAGIPVRLKVEDQTDPTHTCETEAMTTVAGGWETLTFDFINQAAGTAAMNFAFTYNKASIFFGFGTTGAEAGEKTYLWDDVIFTGGGGIVDPVLDPIDLPVTFDDANVDYTVTDFGGAATMLVADPLDAGNQVASTVKSGSAEQWAGTTMNEDPGGFASAIPFSVTEALMTVRVYSPDAGIPVRLKVEDQTDPTRSCETEAMTTVAGAWETLTFDFTDEADGTAALNLAFTFDKASIFFNFGTTGAEAGEKTYLWDDVMFAGGGDPVVNAIDLPITFDEADVDYTLTDFGGAATMLVADPLDAGNQVASTVKGGSAELWAGTTMNEGTGGLASSIPFSASDTQMTVRVYSPDAGIPVRLKVEDHTDPTHSCETEAMTTVAGAWETLTFDFTTEAPGTAALNLTYTFDMASIFFNFGTTGAEAGEKTYLWDDVMFLVSSN